MAIKHFFDEIKVPKAEFTPEGYLSASARVTRAGVFDYYEEGKLVRVLRHPDDVFLQDSLDSLKQIPVTIDHPSPQVSKSRMVDSSNSSYLTVGATGETVTRDNEFVVTNLRVFDKTAVETIKNKGLQEISLGYQTNVIDEEGEYNGEKYDKRQTEIKYNHLSFVKRGRAGPDVRVNLDNKEESYDMANLVTIKLDGIDYQASPEVDNAIKKAFDTNSKLTEEVKSLKSRLDSVEGERDQLKADLKCEKEKDLTKMIEDAAQERIKVLSDSKCVVGDSLSFDGMSVVDIKKSVVTKKYPELSLDDKSEDYINARFDALVDSIDCEGAKKVADFSDSTKNQNIKLDSSNDAYLRYIKRTSNAYKQNNGGVQ